MKKGILLFAMALAIFTSCKEDETPEPTALTLEKNVIHTTGQLKSDGMIELTVSGGTAPYTYAWSNDSTTATIQNLAAGTYTVTVTDAGMQTLTDETTITDPEATMATGSISMGEGYANDVYYSFENGMVKSSPRADWDLAFYTNAFSSSILINDANGVKLYVYPDGDISAWENVNIDNIDSWTAYYNDYAGESWENGAFDQTALGHPDYGWGKYNDQTHNVTGDSIQIIKLSDGSYKKIIIEERAAMTNQFKIKYADIDGSNLKEATINASEHTDMNLIHFSFTTDDVVVHEPASDTWDIVFTKYIKMIDMGMGSLYPYPVTGVLSNNNVEVAKIEEADLSSDAFADAEYSKVISTIGSDWKDLVTMDPVEYEIIDNLMYYVKNAEGYYHKLYFTSFDASTGDVGFSLTSY